jgi:hypothetical protein
MLRSVGFVGKPGVGICNYGGFDATKCSPQIALNGDGTVVVKVLLVVRDIRIVRMVE